MERYGTTTRQLAEVSVAIRHNASLNPAAVMRQPITIDDHENARRIVEARWLANDDGSGATLHELADEFGVSAERIRQIEAVALKKMKGSLAAYI